MFGIWARRSAGGPRGGGLLSRFRLTGLCAAMLLASVGPSHALPGTELPGPQDCLSNCIQRPTVSVTGPVSAAENGGPLTFTFTLSGTAATDTAIDFDALGSAIAEQDYEPVTGRLIIPARETTATLSVPLIDDLQVEAPETLTIQLYASEDADVDGNASVARVVIADDDELSLDLSNGSLDVTEDGTSQTGEFAIALKSEPAAPVVVTFTVEDASEVKLDSPSATFTKDNWNTPHHVTVRGVADGEKDGDQTSRILLAMQAPALKTSSGLPAIEVTTHDADGGTAGSKGEPQQFQAASKSFLGNRLNMLASHTTEKASLSKRSQGGVGSNTIQVTGENGNVHGNFAVSSQGVMSAIERHRAKVEATADLPNTEELVSDWNVWTEGQFGFFKDNDGPLDTKGDFFVGHLGLDYRIGENTIAGIMGEFDWMESREQGSINEIDGNGFLVGPYVSSEIASNIFFDARAMWGLSDNDATQDVGGTVFTGDFQTERLLLEAKLAGQHDIETLRITPEAAVLYTSDDQSAYTITDGVGGTVLVPGQTVDLGRASAGLTFTHLGQMGDYAFEPYIGGKLMWDYENPSATADDLRAALTAGFTLRSAATEFGVQATWDGVGADGYEGLSGKLTFGHAF